MTLNELIEKLQDMQQELGDADPEVKLAIQPQWAFAHTIDDVVVTGQARIITRAEFDAMSEEDQERAQDAAEEGDVVLLDEGEEAPAPVVYIGEGRQDGYLPGDASRLLGWR